MTYKIVMVKTVQGLVVGSLHFSNLERLLGGMNTKLFDIDIEEVLDFDSVLDLVVDFVGKRLICYNFSDCYGDETLKKMAVEHGFSFESAADELKKRLGD